MGTGAKAYRIRLLIRRYLYKRATARIVPTSVSSREIWRISLEMVSENQGDQRGGRKVFVPFNMGL